MKVFGRDLDKEPSKVKYELGVVPQEFNFNMFEKVKDILTTQAGYYGIAAKDASERADFYLRKLGLWDKRRDAARMLSGGMKRRLMIARALVHEPKLLILDEPTAGVDIELRRSMWDFLREINQQGITIILTTHYLEEAESLCRHIGIIDAGRIIKDTNMKVLLKQLQREVFIFDVVGELPEQLAVDGFDIHRVDEHSFELAVDKSVSLNTVFKTLDEQGLESFEPSSFTSDQCEKMIELIRNSSQDQNLVNRDDNKSVGDAPQVLSSGMKMGLIVAGLVLVGALVIGGTML